MVWLGSLARGKIEATPTVQVSWTFPNAGTVLGVGLRPAPGRSGEDFTPVDISLPSPPTDRIHKQPTATAAVPNTLSHPSRRWTTPTDPAEEPANP